MSVPDYNALSVALIGQRIPKPASGTLSGYAAGEPFDKLVYAELRKQRAQGVYRHYEFLNELFLNNPDAANFQERAALIESPPVRFLLMRGKSATTEWSADNRFEEKQNDTADIILDLDSRLELIDVKTRNLARKAQPPNIISAFKLAKVSALMIDSENFDAFTIRYIGLDWSVSANDLLCEAVHSAELFKCPPDTLYINWAAALQIQFQVEEINQQFAGSVSEWTPAYLRHFVAQARRRTEKMEADFIQPFEPYL